MQPLHHTYILELAKKVNDHEVWIVHGTFVSWIAATMHHAFVG